MYNIAIDFGTTNTLIGVYDIEKKEVSIKDFSKISKMIGNSYPVIPSKIAYETAKKIRIGTNFDITKIESKRVFDRMKLYFTKFKARSVKIEENIRIDHKIAARDFLSLLIDLVLVSYSKKEINKLILTAPVDSFDVYRIFLSELCESKNLYNYQILDEPTAVALGYGAVISPDYPYMIIDFGGGTLDATVVRVNNAQKANKVTVIGKAGVNLGGSDIDSWLVKDFLNQQNLGIEDISLYKTELYDKIEKLKIEVNTNGIGRFTIEDKKNDFEMTYELNTLEFEKILKYNYFNTTIQETIDSAIEFSISNGVNKKDIKQVFLVGGSSLLNLFKETVINNFGKRVVIKEPFAAVINGACNFISGTIVEDFLHHNYSIRHFNKNRGIYDYEVIVPEKTKFPVKNIKQLVIAAPYTGQSELELKFFEVMTNIFTEEKIDDISYDDNGNLIVIKDETEIGRQRKIVPLNDVQNDCFIKLNPPAIKSEERVKLSFSVNENRVLFVDAIDLKTGEVFYDGFEIARLS